MTKANPTAPPELRLDIDSHVVRQLGDELITDTGQALLELIKNSYDADGDWAKVGIDTRHSEKFEVEVPGDPTPDGAKPKKTISLQGKLWIEDNGHGMSLADIQRGWLVISLSQKRAFKAAGKVTTKHKRTPLGDKGLGRLGTIKLGAYVVIETHNVAGQSGEKVSFFWADCVNGLPLSKVKVMREAIPPLKKKDATGTTLTVYGLNDIAYWEDSDTRKKLENQLSTLISPFQEFEDFTISVTINAAALVIQSAQAYLAQAQSKFSMIWESLVAVEKDQSPPLEIEGYCKLSLFKVKKNDDFFDRHVVADKGAALLAYLQDHKATKGWDFKKGKEGWFLSYAVRLGRDELGASFNDIRYTDPGAFLGEIYSFDYDETKNPVLGKHGLGPPPFIEEYTGVFVFRDNFRIRMGEDWLGLGQSWTAGSSYYGLKPKNTLGWIAITARENAGLVEKSDREGFVENAARRGFDYLTLKFRNIINDSLADLRRTYLEFKKERLNVDHGKPAGYASGEALKDISAAAKDSVALRDRLADHKKATVALRAAVRGLTKLAKDIPTTSKTRKQIGEITTKLDAICEDIEQAREQAAVFVQQLADLKRAAQVIAEKLDDNSDQFRELYGMAATGLAAQSLIHELQPCIDQMLYAAEQIKGQMRGLGIKNPRLFEQVELTQTNAKAIGNRVRFLDPMMRTYRTKKEVLGVVAFLTELKRFKDQTPQPSKIEIAVTGKEFEVKMNRGQLSQVFDNLFRNAEYWLAAFAKEHPLKTLAITVEVDSPYVRLWDSGYGVDKKIEEELFDLFATTKPREEGHGLGLFLTRELLADNKASISLLPERNASGRRYKFELDFSGSLHG